MLTLVACELNGVEPAEGVNPLSRAGEILNAQAVFFASGMQNCEQNSRLHSTHDGPICIISGALVQLSQQHCL